MFYSSKPLSLKKIVLAILLLPFLQSAFGQMRLPAIIGSNMVLQRETAVPIWGWSTPGQTIVVEFAGQSVKAVAGTDSSWQVKFKALKASNAPRSMTIAAGKQHLKLENILVGEVWLCSGQSNMDYPVDKSEYNYANPGKGVDSSELDLKTPHLGIRVIKVERKLSLPDATVTGWAECEGKTFARSSAVGFYFAKRLHTDLNVPVGIITSAWNGSRIEPWTPLGAYATLPVFKGDVSKNDTLMDNERVGNMFRSMIAPLAPFALKGFIWYQGESNCLIEEHDMRYAYKMQALVAGWRKLWKAQLPFYYTLIGPHLYTKWGNMPHTTETLPLFWEQQTAAAQIPNTDFISVTDLVDNVKDIHPSYKWIVGGRLASVALAKTYHQKGISYSYPQYGHKKMIANKLVIYLKNAAQLSTSDGKSPELFEIAGADGKFVPAEAVIKGRTVELSNPGIKNPVNARLGWAETAMPNLINSDKLPVIPFRTNAKEWVYR